MPRLPLLDKDSAEGDAARALGSAVGHMGVFRMLAHASECVVPTMRLGRAILGKQKLNPRQRELLILLAMRLEGGEYEYVQHVDIALGVGATQEEVDAIADLRLDAPVFSEADKALLAFGRAVTVDVRVPQPVFEAVHAHFDARELVESIIAIGFYMVLARVTEALEVPLDEVQGMTVLKVST